VDLDLQVPPGGRIDVSGPVRLRPLRVDLSVKLRRVAVAPVRPYLQRGLDLLLTGGNLSGSGRVQVERSGDAKAPPDLSFHGDVQLDDLASAEPRGGAPLVAWRSLRLDGLSLTSAPPAVSIGQILLVQPIVLESVRYFSQCPIPIKPLSH